LLEFSPDGRQILLTLPSDSPARYWLMPYPASATNPPRPVFNDVTDITGWSWMPDNRHVILAAGANLRDAGRLWTAELRSGERHALTDGSSNFDSVALSPDGRQLVAVERANRSSVVQMDLTTAAASRLIASERISEGAAWAADVPVMAYVTQRSGGPEIWLHTPGSRDRPLVTAANAPPGETNYFLLPAPSPTGDRVIYSRVQNQQTGAGAARLWIASTSGGPSVPLTNTTDLEIPGSWSPDGNWFVYLGINEAAPSLMMVRTSGQATPVVLKAPVGGEIPAWSPDGQWIKYQMLDGSDHLISQDGVRTRELGNPPSIAWAFSRNSRRLFGIRREGDRAVLFALDVATGAQAVIGPTSWEDYGPGGRMTPGVRFSLAPDGESLVYGTYREHKNLWLMEGFEPERGLLSRLGLR
jgi:dipeptidyl aminopeptidase/acylaminoacyl peptidase